MNSRCLLVLALFASPLLAETIDNCASLLGSIAVELRYARAQPPSTRTTFVCPKDTHSLIGASKSRILNALGPPDSSGHKEDSTGDSWSYFFTGKTSGERGGGYPELSFNFDERQEVSEVGCQLVE